MTFDQLLELTIIRKASDLHLLVGYPPMLRVYGELIPVQGAEVLTDSEIIQLITPILTPSQKQIFDRTFELDVSFAYQVKSRFRINIYRQRGALAVALRSIPMDIPEIEALGLPTVVAKLLDLKQGLILVTGPTGQGKSTTLAACINRINKLRPYHIITVEDPIEYIYPKGRAIVSQREMYSDTHSWPAALRASLREDPDVVLVGEMRDYETIAAAMTIAETGHLVFATLHTNSAAQTIDRVIDVFPEQQQPQIRLQLASSLEAVISQRLISSINPGRVLAVELLLKTPAVANVIREGKSYLVDNIIQTSGELGMISLESSLAKLVTNGSITMETAQDYALRPEQLSKLLTK